MTDHYRPLVQHGLARPKGAVPLLDGALWFSHAERLSRTDPSQVVPAADIPAAVLDRLTTPRLPVAGLDLSQPRLMGILNVTPDSFSDGGLHDAPEAARRAGMAMVADGADILDIGGESTRPGASYVPAADEISRTAPVIAALRSGVQVPISIDTRKADVAQAAVDAGADLVNDVSGFTHDPTLAGVCAARGLPVCIMHAQGDPATMQDAPHYDNVLLDVYDFLESRVQALEALGLTRAQMIVDPGIGFGKTQAHNLALLQGVSLFHGIGCAILLGVSRKGMIGAIGKAPLARDRAPGSIALGLAGLGQGVQILRVHDVAETAQAVRLWQAAV